MHVAIVGAGALGQVYGVRLAAANAASVSFVVRAGHAAPASLNVERIDGDHGRHALSAPHFVEAVPPDADLVVVTVRADQLTRELLERLAAAAREGDRPIVMMTPMLPHTYARARAAVGARLLAAMPSVVAHAPDGVTTRYWLPRVATTLVDEPRPKDEAVTAFIAALNDAGMRARLELGVHETNPATTLTFLPLALGVDAEGGLEAVLASAEAFDRTVAATREASELAKTVGHVASWASIPLKFVGRRTARMGLSLLRARSPEGVSYVEAHFGRKVHAQNVFMAREMVALAAEKGLPHEALRALLMRLETRLES